MYIPYRGSRGGTIINRIRTMIKSNATQFSNRQTCTWESFRSKGPDYGNLIYVEKTSATSIKQHTEKVNIMLTNAQSIKSNELQLYKVIKEENINLCVVTEMWLSNTNRRWYMGKMLCAQQ